MIPNDSISAVPPVANREIFHLAYLIKPIRLNPSEALNAARDLLSSGSLPGLIAVRLITARDNSEMQRHYLLFEASGDDAALVVRIVEDCSSYSGAVVVLMRNHGHWVAARETGRKLLPERRERFALRWACDAQGIVHFGDGLLTSGRWHERSPATIHFLSACNVDGQRRLQSVEIEHDYQEEERLGLVAAINRHGNQCAVVWASAGAVAAIDTNAEAIARACGISIGEVAEELAVTRTVDFRCPEGRFSGDFRWGHHEIVAGVTRWHPLGYEAEWELDDCRLTLVRQPIPDLISGALDGQSLASFLELSLLDLSSSIESAENVGAFGMQDLLLTLKRRTFLLDQRYQVIA